MTKRLPDILYLTPIGEMRFITVEDEMGLCRVQWVKVKSDGSLFVLMEYDGPDWPSSDALFGIYDDSKRKIEALFDGCTIVELEDDKGLFAKCQIFTEKTA